MDSTGRALPDRYTQAATDSERLQAGMLMEPADIEPVYSTSVAVVEDGAQHVLATSIDGEIGGSYFGSVAITEPIVIAVQVLNLDIWNASGALTGTVNIEETSFYSGHIGLQGSAAADGTFVINSDVFTSVVSGRTIEQSFTLSGHIEADGDILKAHYSGTITNLLPDPIEVQGSFSASRPSAAGSERLVMQTGAWSLPPGTATQITATLYDEDMRVNTDSQRITFTTDRGPLPRQMSTPWTVWPRPPSRRALYLGKQPLSPPRARSRGRCESG